MAKKVRFSEVLRRECEKDGADAVSAFDSWDALESRYPKVAEALDADKDHRNMTGAAALEMGRNALISMVGEPTEKKAPGEKKAPAEKKQHHASAK